MTYATDINQIIARCRELKYPVDESGRPNLLFIEGMTDKFVQRPRSIDRYSDVSIVYQFVDGVPKIISGPNICTVSPGLASMLAAPKKGLAGAGLLDKGYHHRVWKCGYHKQNKQGKSHPALVQVNPTRFLRDVNRNWRRDDRNTQVGVRGFNIHRASQFQDLRDVGLYSAGCLVHQNFQKHSLFMLALKSWLAQNPDADELWSATILAVEDQGGMWVNYTTA